MAKVVLPAKSAGEWINWRASWIWTEDEAQPKNAYIYARKTFELSARPNSAKLYCSADSRYRLYVNGTHVGQGPVPSTPAAFYVDSYDVTALLKEGVNCIALLVHHLGEGTYSYIPTQPGLICQLETADQVIGTDTTWKALSAPDWTNQGQRISKRLGFQEVYDARLSLGDWPLPDFYDGGWKDASVVGEADAKPWGKLIPRESPYLVEEIITPHAIVGAYVCPPLPHDVQAPEMAYFMAREELTPLPPRGAHNLQGLVKSRGRTPMIQPPRSAGGASIILDFGKEVTGQVEIALSGWGGGIVDIGYSERLDDGRVRPDRSRMRYTDRYIMRSGVQGWRSFGQRAFRYMQIDFRESPRPVGIEYVRVVQQTQASGAGRFESNEKLLNEIWNAGAYTTRLCMQETFINCPWRERAQWWGDARLMSQVAYYTSGDISLLRQGIRQIAASQREDGSVLGLYPASVDRLVPDYAALWVLSVWEYYAWTGDRQFLAELYPAVTRCLDWFGRFARWDGLLCDVIGDTFIDWAEIDKRGVSTALNCLYYEALHRAGLMAAAIEMHEAAEQHQAAASNMRVAINRYLWSSACGLYVDNRQDSSPEQFSVQTNILAVLFDIPDHYRKITICRRLLCPEWQEKLATPYFGSYFVEILCRTEFYQEALDMIRNRWGDMLKAGATTYWERFTPDFGLCHGWSAGPTRHLSAEFLGVRPVAGGPKVRIAPQPVDLKWARGIVPTPYGNVEVDWKREQHRFAMRMRIPEGMTAEVIAPNGLLSKVTMDGEEYTERLITIDPGDHELRVEYKPQRKVREIPLRSRRKAEESQVELLPSGETPYPERRYRRGSRRKEQPIAVLEQTPKAEDEPVEERPQESTARRKRRRKPTEQTMEPVAVVTVQSNEPVSIPVEEPKQSVGEKRPNRRPRRTNTHTNITAELRPVANIAEPEPSSEPPMVTHDTQPEQPVKRTVRRRRRTRRVPTHEDSPSGTSDIE